MSNTLINKPRRAAPVVATEHDDFPVAFEAFASRLKGTDDEVWTRVLCASCGTQKNVYSAWRAALAAVKKGA
jgi:hypothetical protein